MGRDDEEFERWYRREHPRLVAALTVASGSREVGHDLAGEAFARALERWDRVGAMESPGGWVRQVGVNLFKRRARRTALEATLLRRHRPVDEVSPVEVLAPEVWTAVAGLPPRQRAVVALRVVMDLSQAEAAQLLGVSEGTVSASLVAARRSLAAQLDAHAPSRAEGTEAPRG